VSPVPAGLYALEHEPYDDDAPLVVLVHGTLDRSAAFGRTVQRLSDLHVIVYDRRGYGRSAAAQPPASTLEDHATDLISILDGRPATVVGHSYGGVVALVAAGQRPDLIVAVGVFESPTPWAPWWPAEADEGMAMFATSMDDPSRVAEAFFRRVAGDAAWDELPERTRDDRRSEGRALVADIGSLRDIDAPFDLSALTVPLIVGRGSESMGYQRAGARRMAEEAGVELVEISGGAHGSHTTHPDEFAAFARRAVELGRA